MKSRITSLPILVTALVALGSGLLNLYSALLPSLPARIDAVRRIFPLELIHLSRSLSLLLGFSLIMSAPNIYRRKRTAYWAGVGLAGFSAILHLTKGPDYEEAIGSSVLVVLLFATRRSFTVRSQPLVWPEAIARLAAGLALAVAYGVFGFWLLDPGQFGINFAWRDALTRTLGAISLQSDPSLTPLTRYAHWFLDSLSLITVAAIGYGGYVLFRPVYYRLRVRPLEVIEAQRLVEKYGRSSHDFFKARPDKSFFFAPGQTAFLAYRVGASFAIVLGDPVGADGSIEPLVTDFMSMCRDNDWRLAFYQVLPDFLEVYERAGFNKLKIGDEAIVELANFSLEGRAGKPFRSKVLQIEKAGVRVVYQSPPVPDHLLAQAEEVSDEWLQIPGRRERGFSLGLFDSDYIRSTPLFAAVDAGGKMLAFVNVIPSGRKDEATVDLMRRRTDAPNGIMDYVFVKLFLHDKEHGFERFNLGMAPMSGFQAAEEASPEERAIHAFFQHLNVLFSFKGLHAFKAKFATKWEPRYVVYRTVIELPWLGLALGRVSGIGK